MQPVRGRHGSSNCVRSLIAATTMLLKGMFLLARGRDLGTCDSALGRYEFESSLHRARPSEDMPTRFCACLRGPPDAKAGYEHPTLRQYRCPNAADDLAEDR